MPCFVMLNLRARLIPKQYFWHLVTSQVPDASAWASKQYIPDITRPEKTLGSIHSKTASRNSFLFSEKKNVLFLSLRLKYVKFKQYLMSRLEFFYDPPWLFPWHSYIPFYRKIVATECRNTSFLLQNVKSNLSIEWFPGTLSTKPENMISRPITTECIFQPIFQVQLLQHHFIYIYLYKSSVTTQFPISFFGCKCPKERPFNQPPFQTRVRSRILAVLLRVSNRKNDITIRWH